MPEDTSYALAHQLNFDTCINTQKCCKVGGNLSLQEDDHEEETSKTWFYLMKLETYLLQACGLIVCARGAVLLQAATAP